MLSSLIFNKKILKDGDFILIMSLFKEKPPLIGNQAVLFFAKHGVQNLICYHVCKDNIQNKGKYDTDYNTPIIYPIKKLVFSDKQINKYQDDTNRPDIIINTHLPSQKKKRNHEYFKQEYLSTYKSVGNK